MTGRITPREQAYAAARAVLDAARVRRAVDEQAGRLAPDVVEHLRRLRATVRPPLAA